MSFRSENSGRGAPGPDSLVLLDSVGRRSLVLVTHTTCRSGARPHPPLPRGGVARTRPLGIATRHGALRPERPTRASVDGRRQRFILYRAARGRFFDDHGGPVRGRRLVPHVRSLRERAPASVSCVKGSIRVGRSRRLARCAIGGAPSGAPLRVALSLEHAASYAADGPPRRTHAREKSTCLSEPARRRRNEKCPSRRVSPQINEGVSPARHVVTQS